jgi:hypothetical protein
MLLHSQQQAMQCKCEYNNKESKEPDYDDEKSDKVEEEKQEVKIGEITATTVNTIF